MTAVLGVVLCVFVVRIYNAAATNHELTLNHTKALDAFFAPLCLAPLRFVDRIP
ncbi:MAG: hypothetical protein WAL47_12265 [Pyrinomonadaceae bacterium]